MCARKEAKKRRSARGSILKGHISTQWIHGRQFLNTRTRHQSGPAQSTNPGLNCGRFSQKVQLNLHNLFNNFTPFGGMICRLVDEDLKLQNAFFGHCSLCTNTFVARTKAKKWREKATKNADLTQELPRSLVQVKLGQSLDPFLYLELDLDEDLRIKNGEFELI